MGGDIIKVYISGNYLNVNNISIYDKLTKFEITDNYDEADQLLIMPGGLGAFSDVSKAIADNKDIYLYNHEDYYTPFIAMLPNDNDISDKKESSRPHIIAETDFDTLVRKMEEKLDEQINNGKTGKLL